VPPYKKKKKKKKKKQNQKKKKKKEKEKSKEKKLQLTIILYHSKLEGRQFCAHIMVAVPLDHHKLRCCHVDL
jgi:hypothetical protein